MAVKLGVVLGAGLSRSTIVGNWVQNSSSLSSCTVAMELLGNLKTVMMMYDVWIAVRNKNQVDLMSTRPITLIWKEEYSEKSCHKQPSAC